MNDKTPEETLAEKANQARERLLMVVDELDRKRHNLAHPVRTLKRRIHLPPPISVTMLGATALIAVGTIGYFVARLIAKRRPARRVLLHLPRFLRPEPPKPSFWAEVGTHTARALLTFALIEAGKTAIRRVERTVQAPQTGF